MDHGVDFKDLQACQSEKQTVLGCVGDRLLQRERSPQAPRLKVQGDLGVRGARPPSVGPTRVCHCILSVGGQLKISTTKILVLVVVFLHLSKGEEGVYWDSAHCEFQP